MFWNNDPKNDFDQSARETYEALKRCSVYHPPLHDLQTLCAAAGQFLRVSLDRDRNDKHTIGKLDEDLRRCDRVVRDAHITISALASMVPFAFETSEDRRDIDDWILSSHIDCQVFDLSHRGWIGRQRHLLVFDNADDYTIARVRFPK